METFASGALEATTEHCIRIHASHFKRVLDERFALASLDLGTLQLYDDCRAKAEGLRGKNLSPDTIKKELATLSSVWNWAAVERSDDGQHLHPVRQCHLASCKRSNWIISRCRRLAAHAVGSALSADTEAS